MIKRLSLISVSVALGCIVTVAPVPRRIYIANEDAERREKEDLQQFAAKAVMRTELVTYQAFAAIADMEAAPGSLCSPTQIARYARVSFNYRYVQDGGAYGGGRYLCSPLLGDVRTQQLTLPAPDWQTKDGYLVLLR